MTAKPSGFQAHRDEYGGAGFPTLSVTEDEMSDVRELLARVEAATGPDRQLDCDIAVAVGGFFTLPEKYEGAGIRYGYEKDGEQRHPGNAPDMLVPDYTVSIDAALALVEKVLPGCSWEVGHAEDESKSFYDCSIWTDRKRTKSAATAPLAILAALLRAQLAGKS